MKTDRYFVIKGSLLKLNSKIYYSSIYRITKITLFKILKMIKATPLINACN